MRLRNVFVFGVISIMSFVQAADQNEEAPLSIRLAAPADLEEINKILRAGKGYWGYDEAFMTTFMERFAVREDYIQRERAFITSLDDKTIGFFSFSFEEQQLELDNFFLVRQYIGQGFGRKQWSECLAVAKSYEASSFIIWSDPGAEPFYKKMGCEKIGDRESSLLPNRRPPILQYTFS